MSRKGNCWDNAVAESFFGTLKQELIRKRFSFTFGQLYREVSSYIGSFYNLYRLHSTNGYQSPSDFENNYQASITDAA